MRTVIQSKTLGNNWGVAMPTVLLVLTTTMVMLMGVLETVKNNFRVQKTADFIQDHGIMLSKIEMTFSNPHLCKLAFDIGTGTPPTVATGTFDGNPVPAPIAIKFSDGSVAQANATFPGGRFDNLQVTGIVKGPTVNFFGSDYDKYSAVIEGTIRKTTSSDLNLGSATDEFSINADFYTMTGLNSVLYCGNVNSLVGMCSNSDGSFDSGSNPMCLLGSAHIAGDSTTAPDIPSDGIYADSKVTAESIRISGRPYRDTLTSTGKEYCLEDGTGCPSVIGEWSECETSPVVTNVGVQCLNGTDRTLNPWEDTVSTQCSDHFTDKYLTGFNIDKGPNSSLVYVEGISQSDQALSVTYRTFEACPALPPNPPIKQLGVTITCCKFKITQIGGSSEVDGGGGGPMGL